MEPNNDRHSPHCKQFSEYTMDNLTLRLCRKTKVKPFGFHAISYHIAVQLAHKNWPLIKIQKLLRHKRATTTDFYLRSLINEKFEGGLILDEIENDLYKIGLPTKATTQNLKWIMLILIFFHNNGVD